MKRIPFTQFIQQLCDNASARIGLKVVKATGGAYVPTIAFLEQAFKAVENIRYRNVEHRQTNAIRFTGGSWLEFDLPKHTSRRCYSEEWDGKKFILMVEHHEPYTNDSGTSIKEQSSILIYMLKD